MGHDKEKLSHRLKEILRRYARYMHINMKNDNDFAWVKKDFETGFRKQLEAKDFPSYDSLYKLFYKLLTTYKNQPSLLYDEFIDLFGFSEQDSKKIPNYPMVSGSLVTDPNTGIRWIETPINSGGSKDPISAGIKFFRQVVLEGKSVQECVEMNGSLGKNNLMAYFRSALWSGSLRLSHAPFTRFYGKDLDILKGKYHKRQLREVIVVHLPKFNKSNLCIDANVIRAELVAHVAAQLILIEAQPTRNIFVGGGYTLERFAFNSIPTAITMDSVNWIPLHTFKNDIYNIDARSAIGVTYLLQSIHPRSKATYLPYLSPAERLFINNISNRPNNDLGIRLNACEKILKLTQSIGAVILSVGGINKDDSLVASDGEHFSFSGIQDLYNTSPQSDKTEIVGELLGYFIDKDGKFFKFKNSNHQKLHKELNFGLNEFNLLQKSDSVWVIASGSKVEVVKAVIKAGYANHLIIDEEIGRELGLRI